MAASVNSRRILPLLLLLFAGSGCAALIYEIVWFQLLQLVIGSSAVSLGLLLSAYMGGLCLGSALLPRLISRDYHPLRLYAVIEFGIGLFGLAVLFGLPMVGKLYVATVTQGLNGIVERGAIAALCLLPPTLLMGGSLPAIARWTETTSEGISWMGLLYSTNIAGAVLGCFLAGFYLLRVHDMAVATYAAVAINVAIAMTSFLVSYVQNRPLDQHHSSSAEEGRVKRPWLIYLVVALSGCSALGAEVLWTRLLSLLLGGTVYTFSIILAVFLLGLWAGSTAGSLLARSVKDAQLTLAVCQTLLVTRSRTPCHTGLLIRGFR
jgi:spermidine synthase